MTAGASFLLNCSSAVPDGPIGTSSAHLDTGMCTSDNWTCTPDGSGGEECTCDTGEPYSCPIGVPCTLQDGGPQDYAIVGITDISGPFTYAGPGAASSAQIIALNGHWTIAYTHEILGDPAPNLAWVAIRQSQISPAGTFSLDSISPSTVNTSISNPNTASIPSSGNAICPWSGMIGNTTLGSCTGGSVSNEFGAQTEDPSPTHLQVYRADEDCEGEGPLKATAFCTQNNTDGGMSWRYGTAHPGSTTGWDFPLATGTTRSLDTGATVADAVCYHVEWDNEKTHLGGSGDPYDHVWLDSSGTDWTLNKNYDYISAIATCIPLDQSP
jgi:hypothetical protein